MTDMTADVIATYRRITALLTILVAEPDEDVLVGTDKALLAELEATPSACVVPAFCSLTKMLLDSIAGSSGLTRVEVWQHFASIGTQAMDELEGTT